MQTYECYSLFMNGQTSFEDTECSGHLSSGQTDGNWKKCVMSSIMMHDISLICDNSVISKFFIFQEQRLKVL